MPEPIDGVSDVYANLREAAAYARLVYGVFGPVDAPRLGPMPEPEPDEYY